MRKLSSKETREALRRSLPIVASLLVALVVGPVIGEFFVKWAEESGWYAQPSQKAASTMSLVASFVTQAWFLSLTALVIGLAIGVWVDHLLRRSEANKQEHPVGSRDDAARHWVLKESLAEINANAGKVREIAKRLKAAYRDRESLIKANQAQLSRDLSDWEMALGKIEVAFQNCGHLATFNVRTGRRHPSSQHPLDGFADDNGTDAAAARKFWDQLWLFDSGFTEPYSKITQEMQSIEKRLMQNGAG